LSARGVERIGHIAERRVERIGRIYPLELRAGGGGRKGKAEGEEQGDG